jgi:two-component system OmpR family response regulator
MDNTPRLLVVEDDQETRDLLARYLSGRGFRVATARDGVDMRKRMADGKFDLAILDLMLPGEDGLSLCGWLRTTFPSIPIIMLTALDEEGDRIVGLESGADDYVPKPFSARELVARIHAVLRRTSGAAAGAHRRPERLSFAGFVLEPARRALLDPDGREIDLTAGEYELLAVLAERPRRVMNRDQLLDLTKGRSAAPFDRSVDVQVSRLRRKLRLSADTPDIIKTVRYGGYVFAADVIPC